MPEKCEVCGFWPPRTGVGFPSYPKSLPGLPAHLRGACVFVCDSADCDLKAQERAATAAAQAGITLTTIWRHHLIADHLRLRKPERITTT